MTRVDDRRRDCVVYLYPSEDAAKQGQSVGGSGFVAAITRPDIDARFAFPYAVTNKHVINDGNPVVRLNLKGGGFECVPLKETDWAFSSEDDLAVCALEFEYRYKLQFIPLSTFIPADCARHVGLGDEVYMVGRFISHEGIQRNEPTVRFGNVAQMPSEPIKFKFREQEGYLVDVRSIPGYSGSPVFVRNGNYSRSGVEFKEDYLLGIDCGHIGQTGRLYTFDKQTKCWMRDEDTRCEFENGIAVVIPAHRLAQLIVEKEELIEQRDDYIKAYLKEDHILTDLDE